VRILIFLFLAFVPVVVVGDVTHPLKQFPLSLDYQLAWQRAVLDQNLTSLPPVGPFFNREILGLIEEYRSPSMELTGSLTHSDIRFFSITDETVSARQSEKSSGLFSFAAGAHYRFSEFFSALMLFDLDRRRAIDPDWTGKKWRGLAGDIETAAIYFTRGNLAVTMGRERVYWGPQPINLILSETAEPLDQLAVRFKKGRLHFSFLFARLDQSRPDTLDSTRFVGRTFLDNRYLVGHRLDISFHKNLRVGLFETSLFGGEGRSPELYYLNPLQFFHTAQLNENEDDNTILGLDMTWFPAGGYGLYGQLIVDDFQIDKRSQGDQEPNEIGLMIGAFRAGKPGTLRPDIKIEYVRITNRTYHQRDPKNRYLYRNKLLGHPIGPDADSLSLRVDFWPSVYQVAGFELAYGRHGQGSIYASWDEPWFEIEGDYSEPFPNGTVEKGLHIAGHIEGYLPFSSYSSRHLSLSIRGGIGKYSNRFNVKGFDRSETWLELSVNWLGFLEAGLSE
jgi:hypothetical protein